MQICACCLNRCLNRHCPIIIWNGTVSVYFQDWNRSKIITIVQHTDERSEEDGSRVEEVCGPCSERFGDGRLVKPASQIVFFWCSEFRVDIQAQIAFGKNNPSSILNQRVGSHRYKKILCNHLQFIKYFVIFYTLSLQSDSHFPWMVLLPDEVLWSHL